jgi:hypothetical protein
MFFCDRFFTCDGYFFLAVGAGGACLRSCAAFSRCLLSVFCFLFLSLDLGFLSPMVRCFLYGASAPERHPGTFRGHMTIVRVKMQQGSASMPTHCPD